LPYPLLLEQINLNVTDNGAPKKFSDYSKQFQLVSVASGHELALKSAYSEVVIREPRLEYNITGVAERSIQLIFAKLESSPFNS
jgi:hypothetical protein